METVIIIKFKETIVDAFKETNLTLNNILRF